MNSEVKMNTWKQLRPSRQDGHMKPVRIIWWQLLGFFFSFLCVSMCKLWASRRRGSGPAATVRSLEPSEKTTTLCYFQSDQTSRPKTNPHGRFYTVCWDGGLLFLFFFLLTAASSSRYWDVSPEPTGRTNVQLRWVSVSLKLMADSYCENAGLSFGRWQLP